MSGKKEAFTYVEEKTLVTGLSAVMLTGCAFGAEAFSDTQPVHAAAASKTENQRAQELVNSLYQSAFKGEMPQHVKGLKINQSTRQDVYNKIGEPEQKQTAATHLIYTAGTWETPVMDFPIIKTEKSRKYAISEQGSSGA